MKTKQPRRAFAHAALFSQNFLVPPKVPQPEDSIMISRFSKFGNVAVTSLAIVCSFTTLANAQQPHRLVRGNMIPGQASQIKLMSSPSKAGQVQPVQVAAPDGVELSVVSEGSFVSTSQSDYTVGMQMGLLYRFRISGVEVAAGYELYPSVELLDLLHPPQGLETNFPIPVVITAADIREANAGRMVTKVIYLEDPEVALPRGGDKNEQPWFDISATEDPILAAQGLGRPMAILRIGSRVPTSEELANSSMNAFNSATPSPATKTFQPGLKINPKYPSATFPAVDHNTITVPEAVSSEQN
jgi:hypothetical protein